MQIFAYIIKTDNSSIDTYDEIVEEARKAFIDEIVKIYNAAYQRYLKKPEN